MTELPASHEAERRVRPDGADTLTPRLALHARSILHTNVAIDVRAAREAGYDGIELWIPKLHRFLESGHDVPDLKRLLGPLKVAMIDALLPVETRNREERARLVADCRLYSEVASQLECGAMQVVALDDFGSDDWDVQREALVNILGEMSDIAHPLGVRLAVEPVIFSRFRELPQALELIEHIGPDRIGLCLDSWHLWTAGTPMSEVAAIPATWIAAVQLSDTLPRQGREWHDEDRRALPGDGIIPLRDVIGAINATGYQGTWSVEMLSVEHWEWDPFVLASELRRRVEVLMTDVNPT